MRVLTIDTAMNGCVTGLLDTDSGECFSLSEQMARGQAERLVPLIQSVLAKAHMDFSDVGMIATTVGPGAFTGLRIGLSTARAMGLALNIPVVGVTTLSVLAAAYLVQQMSDKNFLVLIETKRTDFYGQYFSVAGDTLSEPFALPIEMIADIYLGQPLVLLGDANERFLSMLSPEKRVQVTPVVGFEIPDPVFIARIGYALFESGDMDAVPVPLYLRGADVSQSKRFQRVIED